MLTNHPLAKRTFFTHPYGCISFATPLPRFYVGEGAGGGEGNKKETMLLHMISPWVVGDG